MNKSLVGLSAASHQADIRGRLCTTHCVRVGIPKARPLLHGASAQDPVRIWLSSEAFLEVSFQGFSTLGMAWRPDTRLNVKFYRQTWDLLLESKKSHDIPLDGIRTEKPAWSKKVMALPSVMGSPRCHHALITHCWCQAQGPAQARHC